MTPQPPIGPQYGRWDLSPDPRPDRFDAEGVLIPEADRPLTRPQSWLDPDPLHVEFQPVDERVPWHEPGRHDEPAPAWLAWLGLGICVGILLGALIMTVGLWLDAAPSPGLYPTAAPSRDLSELRADASDPGQSGAPLSEELAAPRPPSEAPVPSPAGELGRALVGGWATWCGPTDTQCRGWGGDALLGAVPSFVEGDRPYDVRVCSEAGDCVTVTVVSFCGCADRHGRPTIIDLSPAAFAQLAPLGHGIVLVTVEWPLHVPDVAP